MFFEVIPAAQKSEEKHGPLFFAGPALKAKKDCVQLKKCFNFEK